MCTTSCILPSFRRWKGSKAGKRSDPIWRLFMSRTSRLAQLLKVSPVAAASYCEQVRSITGLGPALHYKTIAQYVTRFVSEAPSAQRLAQLIQTTELKTALKKPKKRSVSRRPINWSNSEVYKSLRRYQVEGRPGSSDRPDDAVRIPFSDHKRVSQEKLSHCPHGVPLIRVCAICDPEKFREMNGFD
jgi:hypothetical protein